MGCSCQFNRVKLKKESFSSFKLNLIKSQISPLLQSEISEPPVPPTNFCQSWSFHFFLERVEFPFYSRSPHGKGWVVHKEDSSLPTPFSLQLHKWKLDWPKKARMSNHKYFIFQKLHHNKYHRKNKILLWLNIHNFYLHFVFFHISDSYNTLIFGGWDLGENYKSVSIIGCISW